MISAEQAIQLIDEHTSAPDPITIPVNEGINHVLASDVFAQIDLPTCDESSMDGYAVHTDFGNNLELVGEQAAGSTSQLSLQKGQAIRIFTGAPIPQGANCVIMQEKITVNNQSISFDKNLLIPGKYIRTKGNHLQKGQLILPKRQLLSPPGIGLAISAGIAEVKVFKLPRIGIIITGNELVEPGKPLYFGQKYNSNESMLKALLQPFSSFPIITSRVSDDLAVTSKAVAKMIDQCDVMVLSGGISVGDHDHVYQALQQNEVKSIFYKVKQKPGKPLYFGTTKRKIVFGLPGNPVSALACTYLYLLPALRKLSGREIDQQWKLAKLNHSVENPSDRPSFSRGVVKDGNIEILPGQDSHMLLSFANANSLVFLEAHHQYQKGDEVKYLSINHEV